ncbi:hypothetical protein [Methanolapillus ohkumae]|uniref:Uncharacterized protein n=1 Tax=Methanolapillus ohkumae TaxID=3028298 RepID=A0AA96ZWA6_9EURY|nr:hypothetical protein MsAm2_16290 [Methanosarcinaceae archaeon Am2]
MTKEAQYYFSRLYNIKTYAILFMLFLFLYLFFKGPISFTLLFILIYVFSITFCLSQCGILYARVKKTKIMYPSGMTVLLSFIAHIFNILFLWQIIDYILYLQSDFLSLIGLENLYSITLLSLSSSCLLYALFSKLLYILVMKPKSEEMEKKRKRLETGESQ